MASKNPRIVIIGAGMAGLTAANKLYTSTTDFELYVVEGGSRIGGRIQSSEFCGDRIETGATWIHGIEGSPIYKIAQEESLLSSHQPWECMGGLSRNPVTLAEGGHHLSPSLVQPISTLFKNLIKSIEGKPVDDAFSETVELCAGGNVTVGSFLRKGFEVYVGKGESKLLEEGVFAMLENTHRGLTAVDDLETLDCATEREYKMFPGEEITIARGYSQVIESLASVLPEGTIQLGRRVQKIEWHDGSAVELHFSDGSCLSADHVIVTVSLGVLKHGASSMFEPPLPSSKIGAISRLGFGVLNKVFLELPPSHDHCEFPFMQMVFHPTNSEQRDPNIPDWIRRTCWFYPIYRNSRVVLSWFAGKEAIEIESLSEDEITNGFSTTASNLLSSKLKFENVLRTQWSTDPLFLGSYSHVPVGSSGDDMDTLSEPLPQTKLKILFAGEATHRTHYGTTHGAFISGLREANRLLKHYNISVAE
ncbi:hypothetical protein ACS0TY_028863 [Phlomoides rotata]